MFREELSVLRRDNLGPGLVTNLDCRCKEG